MLDKQAKPSIPYMDPDFDVRRSMTGKEFKEYVERKMREANGKANSAK